MDIGGMISNAIGWVGDTLEMFEAHPISLVGISVALVGTLATVAGSVLRGGRRSRR